MELAQEEAAAEAEGRLSRQSSFRRAFYSPVDEEYTDGADAELLLDITEQISALSFREARATQRMQMLTRSQLRLVMESCGLLWQEKKPAEEAAMVAMIVKWRAERGDFSEKKEPIWQQEDIDEFPQIPDDMDGISESILKTGFLVSDLQLECLLRGIPYKARDTRAGLVGRLLKYKEALSLKCENSFQVLAEQSI